MPVPAATKTFTPKPTNVVPRIVILNSTHRCDACQAQAYVRTVTTLGTFEWCSHHFNRVADALMERTTETIDERWRLFEVAKLDVSA